jgi:hypothetical protein
MKKYISHQIILLIELLIMSMRLKKVEFLLFYHHQIIINYFGVGKSLKLQKGEIIYSGLYLCLFI